jgi:hypothetical protein
MAFPASPNIGDTHTENDTLWTYGSNGWYSTVIGDANDTKYTCGPSLGSLNDVDLDPPPSDGDALVYDSATDTWIPGAGGGGGGGDTVTIQASAADVLSVSSGAISADDAGADKLVFWDDSASKLTHLTLGTNLSITDTTINATGGATPGGSNTQIQFNDGGSTLGGDADLTWNKTTNVMTVAGDVNLNDGGTFTTTLQTVTPTANRTISFPDATGTVGLVAGSSGQVVYNNAGAYAGGNLGYNATTGVFGYVSGTGTVTQATNKATGVTLNSPSGQITLNSAALAADTTVSFTLTNSSITANDVLILNHLSGGTAGSYLLNAQAAAGSASINVRNITAGSLSEAIVIGFAVIKTP